MPTYEYKCNACKKSYELRQGFDAETTHKCEECGKGTAKRVLVAPRVVFKGSGWYATDSRGKSSATAESDSKGESTETKPDTVAKETKTNESKPGESKPTSTAESSAAS